MKKRGQITLFILLGLMILISLGIYFMVSTEQQEDIMDAQLISFLTPTEKEAILAYTRACFRASAREAIDNFGIQGGYLYPSDFDNIEMYGFYIPYYLYQNENIMPEQNYFEDAQLNDYIKYRTEDCLGKYKEFKKKGYYILVFDTNVDSRILSNEIKTDYDIELLAIKENKIEEIKGRFDYNEKSNVKEMLDIADDIVEKLKEDPDNLDVNYFSDLNKGQYIVKLTPYSVNSIFYYEEYGDYNYIVTIEDKNNIVDGEPYTLAFGARLKI